MSQLMQESTLAELVIRYPETTEILERRHLDFCCGGQRTLRQACDDMQIDVASLVDQLQETIAASNGTNDCNADWTARPLAELCEHITMTHHALLRRELPRLDELSGKIVSVHASRHPELLQVRDTIQALRAELMPHMIKEEQILFPAICQIESLRRARQYPFGSISNPIRMMLHEHHVAADYLKRLRSLTDDYRQPEDHCTSWRLLVDGLRNLEADLHVHIHKENNILFPGAARLEAEQA